MIKNEKRNRFLEIAAEMRRSFFVSENRKK